MPSAILHMLWDRNQSIHMAYKVPHDLPLLPSPAYHPEAPVLQPFTTTCCSPDPVFLDFGSFHMLFLLPKSFLLVPILHTVNSYLPSRLKCHLLPAASLGLLLYRALLCLLSGCPSPHRASSLWVQGRGSLRAYTPACPHLPILDHAPGTWDPGNPCLNDLNLLPGLEKAWISLFPGSVSQG